MFSRTPRGTPNALRVAGKSTKHTTKGSTVLEAYKDREFNGILRLQRSSINLSKLSLETSIHTLVLDFCDLESLEGLKSSPTLVKLSFNGTKVGNLAGFPSFISLKSIEYRDTPLDRASLNRLAVILLKLPNLDLINGLKIYQNEKNLGNQYPEICSKLVRLGWMPSLIPPSEAAAKEIALELISYKDPRPPKAPKSPISQKLVLEEVLSKQEAEIRRLEKAMTK